MQRILAKTAALLLTAAVPAAAASAQASLAGEWTNRKGSMTVKVAPCGSAWCATVVEATESAKASARKGGTPRLIGTQILSGVRPEGDGIYKGRAFDPKRNLRAPATIKVLDSSTIVVKGCVISGIVCREQRWTKVG